MPSTRFLQRRPVQHAARHRVQSAGPVIGLLALLTSLTVDATAGPQSDASESATVAQMERLASTGRWAELADAAAGAGARLARRAHRDPAQYARFIAYRAVAHHQLGRAREAIWDWQAALNLDPDTATATMSTFHDTAEVFAKIGVPSVQLERDPAIRPARPKKTTRLDILTPAGTRRAPAAFGLNLIVGTDGVPHSPQVVSEIRGEGDRVYSALEAFREWRFAPATANGVAVEFPMSISVSLGARGTPSPPRARRF